MKYNAELESSRLKLLGWNQETYDVLFEQYSKDDIMRLIGIHTDAEFEFEKKRYQGGFSTYNMTVQFFQMIAKEDQRIIGWCGFHSWTQQHRRAELFYLLKEDKDKRKGLMKEAVTEVLKYGKEVMKLRRIEAFVGINNSASFQLLEKFGFQKEATIKHRYLFDEKVEWDYLYSLLPNEM